MHSRRTVMIKIQSINCFKLILLLLEPDYDRIRSRINLVYQCNKLILFLKSFLYYVPLIHFFQILLINVFYNHFHKSTSGSPSLTHNQTRTLNII